MNNTDTSAIIRELAKQQTFGVKKAVALGGSFAVVVPMVWLKWHGVLIDGEYYFKMDVSGDTLVISPITDEDVEGVTIKRKEGSSQL